MDAEVRTEASAINVKIFMSEDTKIKLLEAAERILIEEGVHALTVRRIGAVSGLNSTLITYHFGSMSALLAELCRINLEPMLARWEKLGKVRGSAKSLRGILRAWLGPLLQPSMFTPGGRTLVVFDEIASHGDQRLRDELLAVMIDMSVRVQAALRPYLPHLSTRELRARVRFISAAALEPPPRFRKQDLQTGGAGLNNLNYFIAFAEASLLGAPWKPSKAEARV